MGFAAAAMTMLVLAWLPEWVSSLLGVVGVRGYSLVCVEVSAVGQSSYHRCRCRRVVGDSAADPLPHL